MSVVLRFWIGFVLLSPVLAHTAVLENPSGGNFYSGVGVISGWKCEANGPLTVRFDGGPPIPLAYRNDRPDTEGVCGDTNNGFVAIWNWARLGDGSHTAVIYDNGVEFGRSMFEVVTLGEEFVMGAMGECRVEGFPREGAEAVLIWQEAAQQFTAREYEPNRIVKPGERTVLPGLITLAWQLGNPACTPGIEICVQRVGGTNVDNVSIRSSVGDIEQYWGPLTDETTCFTLNEAQVPAWKELEIRRPYRPAPEPGAPLPAGDDDLTVARVTIRSNRAGERVHERLVELRSLSVFVGYETITCNAEYDEDCECRPIGRRNVRALPSRVAGEWGHCTYRCGTPPIGMEAEFVNIDGTRRSICTRAEECTMDHLITFGHKCGRGRGPLERLLTWRSGVLDTINCTETCTGADATPWLCLGMVWTDAR